MWSVRLDEPHPIHWQIPLDSRLLRPVAPAEELRRLTAQTLDPGARLPAERHPPLHQGARSYIVAPSHGALRPHRVSLTADPGAHAVRARAAGDVYWKRPIS